MIYFIQEAANLNAPIKIGHATDPLRRISELQTGYPGKLIVLHSCEGDSAREKEEHQRWDHLHIHGEWFRAEPELLDYIRQLRPGHRTEDDALARLQQRYPGEAFQRTGLRKQCPWCWKMGWVFVVLNEDSSVRRAYISWDGEPPADVVALGFASIDSLQVDDLFDASFGCGFDPPLEESST